jgi:CubicO group peptidase (beta-lactamase class C family)
MHLFLLVVAAVAGHSQLESHQRLSDEIRAAIQPQLDNLSLAYNHSSWSFAYRDAYSNVTLCSGFRDRNPNGSEPCRTSDVYAWGSGTKPTTALRILQLVEAGEISLDDSFVSHADDYVRHISGGSTDLLKLYGPVVQNVSIRHLLQMRSGISEYDNQFVRTYQNTHRSVDLDPLWILNHSNRTFVCPPGTCGKYSSTNYVLLGLVLASHQQAVDWDKLDQRAWIINHTAAAGAPPPFDSMRFPVHGLCNDSRDSAGDHLNSSTHGYQLMCRDPSHLPPPQSKTSCVWEPGLQDTLDMSCTQGWTCGNMLAVPSDIAEFWWRLLGPDRGQHPLLNSTTLAEMITFEQGHYFGSERR